MVDLMHQRPRRIPRPQLLQAYSVINWIDIIDHEPKQYKHAIGT